MDITLKQLEKELDVTLDEAIDMANRFTNDIRSFQFLVFFVEDLPVTEFLVALDPCRKKGEITTGTASFIINCYEEKAIQLGPEGSWLYRLASESIAQDLRSMNEKLQSLRQKAKMYERAIKDSGDKFPTYLIKMNADDVWDLARAIASDEATADPEVIISLDDFLKDREDKLEDYGDIMQKLKSHSEAAAAKAYTQSA